MLIDSSNLKFTLMKKSPFFGLTTVITVMSFLVSMNLSAQYYTFSHFNQTYDSLENGSTFEICDDEVLTDVAIGFDFPIFEYTINELQLHQTFLLKEFQVAGNDVGVQIFPFGASYGCQGFTSEGGLYHVSGTPGNRVFTVEWKNIGFINDTVGDQFMNYQAKFFEFDGAIEFHFGENHITQNDIYFTDEPGGFVGIIKYDPFVLNIFPGSICLIGDPSSPLLSDYDHDIEEVTLQGFPANGTVYRFARTGIGMNEVSTDFRSVYPNPVAHSLQIELINTIDETHLLLCDVYGNIVKTYSTNSTQTTIDVSDLSSGVYFLKNGMNGKEVKLIKQ